MRLYEAMFLVDNNLARTNFEDVEKHIRGILARFEGETVQFVKWAERKLAYNIKHNNTTHTKGTYILVHFKSEPQAIIKMDRQFTLSEMIIRHMIVRDEDGLLPDDYDPEPLSRTEEVKPYRKPSRSGGMRGGNRQRSYGAQEKAEQPVEAEAAAKEEGGEPKTEKAPSHAQAPEVKEPEVETPMPTANETEAAEKTDSPKEG